jgi:hypothetical protein
MSGMTTDDPTAFEPDELPAQETTREFVDALQARIGRRLPCPIYGGTVWTAVKWPVAFMVVPSEGIEGFHGAAFVCDQCSFLRVHSMTPVVIEPDA